MARISKMLDKQKKELKFQVREARCVDLHEDVAAANLTKTTVQLVG